MSGYLSVAQQSEMKCLIIDGHSAGAIARRLKCDPTTVRRRADGWGIPLYREPQHIPIGPTALSDSQLIELRARINNRQTAEDIAAAIGTTDSTVWRRAREWGLEVQCPPRPKRAGIKLKPRKIKPQPTTPPDPIEVSADHCHRYGPQLYCDCGAVHSKRAEVTS